MSGIRVYSQRSVPCVPGTSQDSVDLATSHGSRVPGRRVASHPEAQVLRGVAYALFAVTLVSVALWGCGGRVQEGLARGHDLYDTCKPCHGVNGGGNQALGAPSIAGLPRWYLEAQLNKFRSGLRGMHPSDMEGHRMRPMARSLNIEGDVSSVAQYVSSMKPQPAPTTLTGGNVEAGSAKYTTVCIACHGADASGMEAMGAPTLINQADWYMLRQLEKFQTGMRGTDTTDVQGQQMAAMSAMVPDHQSMLDVLAYIHTLRK
jgi:cytochrome c oxidase subunit 2